MTTSDRPEMQELAERLVLEMASFGSGVSKAMADATGSPDFVANAPLLVLCLLDLDGPARPSAIGAVVGLTSGGTTKLLDRMEEAGLIRRAYGVFDDDHRGVQVTLTPRGRKLLRTAAGALVDHLPDVASVVKNIVATLEVLQAD
jgi:DNA-binding MarR family transcriptional regulator